jgi:hypothetical protein
LADFLIHSDEGLTELFEIPELGDFLLYLLHHRQIGQALSHGFSLLFAGKLEMRSVARVVGSSTMASGLAAAAKYGGNGSGPHIAQLRDLLHQRSAGRLQSRKGVGHDASYLK